jgi:hypothetical protein
MTNFARISCVLLALMLPLSACANGPWKDNFGELRSAAIPGPVRDFVIKAQGCTHFGGEEGYDAARKAEIEKAIAAACPGLDEKRALYLARYAGNADVKAIIDEVWPE